MNARITRLLVSAIAVLSAHPVHADEPIRGPYLQNLTGKTVEILWTSEAPGESQLRYFGSGRWRTISDSTAQITHHLTLPLDRCDSPCRYRVGVRGNRLSRPVRIGHTGHPPATLTVLAIGDSGAGGAAQYEVARALNRERAPILLHLGDIVYPSGLDTDYDPQFFAPYKRLLARTVVYPILGNHDALNSEVYTRIFALPARHSISQTERYYSFSYGPLHGIALDSNSPLDRNSEQFRWLQDDIARTDRGVTPWTIVFLHHPLYSSGKHGSTFILRSALEELLEKSGVHVILSGHDHNYERSEPGPLFGGRGIVHIVSGGGGNPHLGERRRENGASRMFAVEHHYLKLRITPERLVIEALKPDGTRLDYTVLTREK